MDCNAVAWQARNTRAWQAGDMRAWQSMATECTSAFTMWWQQQGSRQPNGLSNELVISPESAKKMRHLDTSS